MVFCVILIVFPPRGAATVPQVSMLGAANYLRLGLLHSMRAFPSVHWQAAAVVACGLHGNVCTSPLTTMLVCMLPLAPAAYSKSRSVSIDTSTNAHMQTSKRQAFSDAGVRNPQYQTPLSKRTGSGWPH